MFYTYMHTRNDTGKPFYIGKGIGQRAFYKKNRNIHWHRIVNKHGYEVVILSKWNTEDEAFLHEKFLISTMRLLSIPICNLTDGGEGPSGLLHSKESKEKNSLSHKGKKASADTKLKMSLARKGMKRSAKSIEMTRIASIGRKHSDESRKKMSVGRTGVRLSEEHCKAISIRNTGRITSDETKAKLSAVFLGRKVSRETAEKISKSKMRLFIEFNGEMKSLTEWARFSGISKERLHARLKAGWPIELALSKKTSQGKKP